MCKILFKAKRIDNGEWVYFNRYGAYCDVESNEIQPKRFTRDCGYKVDPSTIGQFTGLTDKNDVDIYEGDKIDHIAFCGNVIFEDGMFSCSTNAKVNFGYRQPLCYCNPKEIEVIGNIHESILIGE